MTAAPTWRSFATELRYRPGKTPEVVAARPPLGGLKPLRPGLWELSANVVVEAVAAGLWVRAAGTTSVDVVRAAPVDPEWARLTVGVPGEPVGDDVSVAGAKLFAGLDAETQRVVRLVFGEAPVKEPEPEVEEPTAVDDFVLVPAVVEVPVVESPAVASDPMPTSVDVDVNYDIGDDLPTMVLLRRQMELVQLTGSAAPVETWSAPVEPPPVPARIEPFLVDPGIDVDTMLDTLVAAETALDEHRAWVRRTLGDQYDSYAGRVLRLLIQHPSLREGELQSVVTDLVAVLVYLAAGERKADEALLSGDVDALLPFLSCVISGLQRLPVYEGVAFCGGAMDPGTHRAGAILTEVSFLNAVTAPEVALPGDAEFVIWSDSGRRTGFFEPELDPIVFLPGTRFQVLGVRGPSPARRDRRRRPVGQAGGGRQAPRLDRSRGRPPAFRPLHRLPDLTPASHALRHTECRFRAHTESAPRTLSSGERRNCVVSRAPW